MSTPIIPIPRIPVTVRPATPVDLAFIDSLQKMHTKQVGWMPTKSLEQKVASGQVLIAEEVTGHSSLVTCGRPPEVEGPASDKGQVTSDADVRVGYCIATDRYMKREDCGIIYQVNVAPGRQRGLIGAALVRAVFDRAAYGCRLFCCWCAQDIEANRFWESLGFIPLAFRAGSREKGRVHIFWQRRIRAGDATTPYWFPSPNDRRLDPRGPAGVPDPAGRALGGCDAEVSCTECGGDAAVPRVFRTEGASARSRCPYDRNPRRRRWADCSSPAPPSRRPNRPPRGSRSRRRRTTPGWSRRQGNCATDGWSGSMPSRRHCHRRGSTTCRGP